MLKVGNEKKSSYDSMLSFATRYFLWYFKMVWIQSAIHLNGIHHSNSTPPLVRLEKSVYPYPSNFDS